METIIPAELLTDKETVNYLKNVPDELLQSFSFPLMGGSVSRITKDEDGFSVVSESNLTDLHALQEQCWLKAEKNPQINSHVRDTMGRMAGWGFSFNAQINELQKDIDELCEDPRNDLYQKIPKFCARTEIEGELFLCYTLHDDGFIEVDFIAPSKIRGGGDKDSGIIFHPTKQDFPLFYCVNFDGVNDSALQDNQVLIPSINICYYPELEETVKNHGSYRVDKLKYAKAKNPNKKAYKDINGYCRFIVHWNKGFLTKRNASHIKTTIEWVNHYETLKNYEINHKKSSGAYLWVIMMDDIRAFRGWLNLSEEERKKTGIMHPKDPGGTLVMPPGMRLECVNPKLTSISDQDTDIMQMVSSGLQKPQDVMLGDYRSSYASVKASQGPQGDRINDELHYLKLFLTYDFWRPICWLRSLAKPDFKFYRSVEEVVDFKNKEPVKKRVKKEVYKLIDICFPTSRIEDIESISKALLGSKHASIADTLGIPRSIIAQRLGFNNYQSMRKMKATEDETLPETLSVMDQEAAQEKKEAEPVGDKSDQENETKNNSKKNEQVDKSKKNDTE